MSMDDVQISTEFLITSNNNKQADAILSVLRSVGKVDVTGSNINDARSTFTYVIGKLTLVESNVPEMVYKVVCKGVHEADVHGELQFDSGIWVSKYTFSEALKRVIKLTLKIPLAYYSLYKDLFKVSIERSNGNERFYLWFKEVGKHVIINEVDVEWETAK